MKRRRKKRAEKKLLKTQPRITTFFTRSENNDLYDDDNDNNIDNTNVKHRDDPIFSISDFDTELEEQGEGMHIEDEGEGIHFPDLNVHVSPQEINNEEPIVWNIEDFDSDVAPKPKSSRKARKKWDKQELDE